MELEEELFKDFSQRFPEIKLPKDRYLIFLKDARSEIDAKFFGDYYVKAVQLHIADSISSLESTSGGALVQVSTGSVSKTYASNDKYSNPYRKMLHELIRSIDFPILVI